MENVIGQRNLKVRKEKYYLRITVKGRKYFETLHVPFTGRKAEEKEAIARMEEKLRLIRNENFSTTERKEAMDETRTKVSTATIGKLIDRYKTAAAASGIKKETVRDYINSLKVVIRTKHPGDPSNLPCTILTDDLVIAYRDSVLASRPKTKGAQDTARRTIQSTLTQARAVFAKWTYTDFKSLKLPNMDGFLRGGMVRAKIKKYELPAHHLIKKTVKAGRALRDPIDGEDEKAAALRQQLFLAFLLTYDLGLRAEEAVQCKRSWFRKDDQGIHWLGVIHREDEEYDPKTPRSIPVPALIYADLMELGCAAELLGGSVTARRNLIQRSLAPWMRSLGWTRNKCAHELRKLRGSFWRSKYGLDRAHAWLGHSSYQTTLDYYAQLPDEPEPMAVDDDLEALRKR